MSENIMGGRAVGAGQGWTWIADGFGLFKKAPGMWIALVIVLFVILVVLAFIPLLGAVATFLLMPLFVGGLMLGCRALQSGGELELGHLFAGFKTHTANLIVLGALAIGGWIIVMLPVIAIVGAGAMFGMMRGDAAGAAAMGGSFVLAWLIAMALSIPIYMALWFAPALVVLRGHAPVAAVKESFLGCLKNIVPFLIYGLVMVVLGIVAAIPLGLGWLVLGPVAIASVYTAYRDIYGDA
ncbi:MAG TPA: BPSS1780 family membrane protein [Burkholderiales bacterium]|nr:BPSS1780 family membrane protein [Burkholderiales bacterium]